MRHPPARTVVLVQLGAGRGDYVDHPLLPREELGAGAGQQPGPTPPEQPDTIEGQLHRSEAPSPATAAETATRSQVRSTAYDTCGRCRPWVCERRLGTPARSSRSHRARTARSERRSNRRQTANATPPTLTDYPRQPSPSLPKPCGPCAAGSRAGSCLCCVGAAHRPRDGSPGSGHPWLCWMWVCHGPYGRSVPDRAGGARRAAVPAPAHRTVRADAAGFSRA